MTDAAPAATSAPAPSAAPAAGGEASAPVSAPAAAASSPQPADGRTARENRADRHARVLAKVDAKQAERSSATPAAADAPPAGGEPAAPAPAEPAKAEPAPVAPQDALTPAQQQAMRDAARAEREAWETKQELKRLREETASAKAAEEARRKMSPLELLAKERGISYEELTKDIVAGKHKELSPEQIALAAHDEKVAALEARLKAFEDKEAAQKKAAELETNAERLNAELKQAEHVKRFPVLAALPDAGKRVLELKEQFPDASYEDIATHLETQIRGLQSVDVIKARFSADPEYKAQVLAALGLTQSPQPAQQVPQGKPRAGTGPDAISATRAADPGARSQPVKDGRAGRVAAALAAANARQRASLG